MTTTTAPTWRTVTLATYRLPVQRDVYERHRDVARLADGIPGRTLWAEPRPGLVHIQAAAPLPDPHWTLDLGISLAALTDRTPVAWSLIGSPVEDVCRRAPDGTRLRSRRQALPAARREEWILRKLTPALAVTGLVHEPLPPAAGRKGDMPILHTRHAYAGTGTVVDAEALREMVAAGVGKGRAFGCGLLLVREVAP